MLREQRHFLFFPKWGLILALFLAGFVLAACGEDPVAPGQGGEEKPRVLIVHSYDNGFRWTADQHEGIIEGLRRSGYSEDDIELRVFYMDTRVNFLTADQIAVRAGIALRTIDEFAPQLVFVTDDTAVEEVALPYMQDHPTGQVSFVFSGINGEPDRYAPVGTLEIPGARLTGTVERVPFRRAFDAAIRVFGPMERVVVFADDSLASGAVWQALRRSLQEDGATYPLQVVEFVEVSTFEEWKQKVSEYQSRADSIAVLNYHRIRDQNGNIVQPGEVAKWTVDNSDISVFGLLSDWSADGYVMSYGNSGFETGAFVGDYGAEVLKGRDAGQMPIVDPNLYEMTFNQTTIDRLEITVPSVELDRAATIFE